MFSHRFKPVWFRRVNSHCIMCEPPIKIRHSSCKINKMMSNCPSKIQLICHWNCLFHFWMISRVLILIFVVCSPFDVCVWRRGRRRTSGRWRRSRDRPSTKCGRVFPKFPLDELQIELNWFAHWILLQFNWLNSVLCDPSLVLNNWNFTDRRPIEKVILIQIIQLFHWFVNMVDICQVIIKTAG